MQNVIKTITEHPEMFLIIAGVILLIILGSSGLENYSENLNITLKNIKTQSNQILIRKTKNYPKTKARKNTNKFPMSSLVRITSKTTMRMIP